MAEILRDLLGQYRAMVAWNAGTPTYKTLGVLLLNLAPEKDKDKLLHAYRPRGSSSGNNVFGYQGPQRSGPGQNTKNPRYMSDVQDLFVCHSGDEERGLVHAPDCDMHECFVVQETEAETNHHLCLL